jgi:hypothetical protein
MPVTFPEWDDAENRLVDRDYLSLSEVAAMLHIARATAYERLKADHWPYLQVANRVWISERDLVTILAGMRHNDAAPTSGNDGATALGEPLPADPWIEPDGGGVR